MKTIEEREAEWATKAAELEHYCRYGRFRADDGYVGHDSGDVFNIDDCGPDYYEGEMMDKGKIRDKRARGE